MQDSKKVRDLAPSSLLIGSIAVVVVMGFIAYRNAMYSIPVDPILIVLIAGTLLSLIYAFSWARLSVHPLKKPLAQFHMSVTWLLALSDIVATAPFFQSMLLKVLPYIALAGLCVFALIAVGFIAIWWKQQGKEAGVALGVNMTLGMMALTLFVVGEFAQSGLTGIGNSDGAMHLSAKSAPVTSRPHVVRADDDEVARETHGHEAIANEHGESTQHKAETPHGEAPHGATPHEGKATSHDAPEKGKPQTTENHGGQTTEHSAANTETAHAAEQGGHGEAHEPAPQALSAHAVQLHAELKLNKIGHQAHWSYDGEDGPRNWAQLQPDYALCQSGLRQSPIDIQRNWKLAKDGVKVNYRPGTLRLVNNGHTVQSNFAGGNTLSVSGETYQLLQMHFHAPSEHLINGVIYPVELHFVHSKKSGELAVLGVLVEAGASNFELEKFIRHAPNQTGVEQLVSEQAFDPNKLLPKQRAVYQYLGSLTTPPCSEGVKWSVLKEPIQASHAQIARLRKMYPNNSRPVQDLNNRVVGAFSLEK